MKRSEINQIIREALAFFDQYRFKLPPFGYWSPDDWANKGPECRAIVEQQLGWDVTDLGSGDFERVGLVMFTIRNGSLADIDKPGAKTYAEKLMIVHEEQVTPTHMHWQKTEDIINRGGGELVCRLWNCTADEKLDDNDVTVQCDGMERTVAAGGAVILKPGESVTLPTRVWHTFWGLKGKGTVLIGEVSRVNDDHTDNCFLDPVGRFPAIEEDEPPLHLMVNDYARYYPHATR